MSGVNVLMDVVKEAPPEVAACVKLLGAAECFTDSLLEHVLRSFIPNVSAVGKLVASLRYSPVVQQVSPTEWRLERDCRIWAAKELRKDTELHHAVHSLLYRISTQNKKAYTAKLPNYIQTRAGEAFHLTPVDREGGYQLYLQALSEETSYVLLGTMVEFQQETGIFEVNTFEPYYLSGMARFATRDYGEAQERLTRAIELSPASKETAEAHYVLGCIAISSGQSEEFAFRVAEAQSVLREVSSEEQRGRGFVDQDEQLALIPFAKLNLAEHVVWLAQAMGSFGVANTAAKVGTIQAGTLKRVAPKAFQAYTILSTQAFKTSGKLNWHEETYTSAAKGIDIKKNAQDLSTKMKEAYPELPGLMLTTIQNRTFKMCRDVFSESHDENKARIKFLHFLGVILSDSIVESTRLPVKTINYLRYKER